MLGDDQLLLGRQQLLVLDQHVERRGGADQRLSLDPFQGDLRRPHRRGNDEIEARAAFSVSDESVAVCTAARLASSPGSALTDGLLGLPGLRILAPPSYRFQVSCAWIEANFPGSR